MIEDPTATFGKIKERGQYYPDYIELYPHLPEGISGESKLEYFRQFRQNAVSRYLPSMYRWGTAKYPYEPKPELKQATRQGKLRSMLEKPSVQIRYVDPKQRQRVDDFYIACQLHREQYRDHTGMLHPLDWFKKTQPPWQCPPDILSNYLRYPLVWTRYKKPNVLPVTLQRTLPMPHLPNRVLTGVYSPDPDTAFKR